MRYLGILGSLPTPQRGAFDTDFRYRAADGSYNSLLFPSIGMAGTPYAKSVTAKVKLPAKLPDPALLFDTLFVRDKIIEHPTKTSSLLFNLAAIIIHDVLKTDPMDTNKSSTSSYLDLAPLYGSNRAEQTLVRTMADGKLKPDTFSEYRLLGFPPGVSAFLISFNRFHNYAVTQLAVINQDGRFTKPAALGANPTAEAHDAYNKGMVKYDEDLFQTAKLVTCGLYVNIILNDYVKNILNLNRVQSSWSLDPRDDFGHLYDQTTAIPSATGNAVSVEFNLIYRWHACISTRDAKWTENFYEHNFGVSDPSTIPPEELQRKLRAWAQGLPKDPSKWEFSGLKRGRDGKFDDRELVDLITKSTEDIAGSFGPKNIPKVMRSVEILGIIQARKWKVATLNEFRQFFQLTPHKTFEDLNPDPTIAQTLKNLYEHPDKVELYPGILAEDAKKPLVPGSGLCAGFTISKAILSDAVSLTRGDRLYTIDYTPSSLTNWGYTEVASDPAVIQGRVLYKLFMNAFPGWYRSNSVYAMFPFTVPSETKTILEGFGTAKDFSFDLPSYIPQPTPCFTYRAVKEVLRDNNRFHVPWGPHVHELTGRDYMLSGDQPSNYQEKDGWVKSLYGPQNSVEEIEKFYEVTTWKMLKDKSYSAGKGFRIDAVRDIGNLVQSHFVATLFHIPLKTADNPTGFTEEELYKMHATLFAWVFLDIDTAKSFELRQNARKAIATLAPAVQAAVEAVKAGKPPVNPLPNDAPLSKFGNQVISSLLQDKTVQEAVGTILPTVPAIVLIGQAIAQLLELFLSPPYNNHWPIIQRLAKDTTNPASSQQLRKYVLEGTRLSPIAFGVIRQFVSDMVTIQDGPGRSVNLKKDGSVFLDLVSACLDPLAFPDPLKIDLKRPEENYIQFGYGKHQCLGQQLAVTALTSLLRVFGKLQGLRIEDGQKMKSKVIRGSTRCYMKEEWDEWYQFPTTLQMRFDSFVE
ncbi:fatty acid oxygenase [Trichophaea hybrida]|nr:fatty acid oxygenase [Trichophaea hybrida]